jgi:hypothetical protein
LLSPDQPGNLFHFRSLFSNGVQTQWLLNYFERDTLCNLIINEILIILYTLKCCSIMVVF